MKHSEPHPLAGQTVKLANVATDPRGMVVDGAEYRIEDWWDLAMGVSWMDAQNNPAALQYAYRTGAAKNRSVPIDDEVLYGKIGGLGHLVHVSELDGAE